MLSSRPSTLAPPLARSTGIDPRDAILRSQTIATELDGGSNSRKGSRAPEDRKLGDYEQDADEPPAKKQKKQGESTLHSIKWRRVVLDEGHLIKNPKAKMTRACTQLKAE